MLSVGIDTDENIHYVEIQNEKGTTLWRREITNKKKDFELLIENINRIENRRNDGIKFVFMKSTGDYHMPLKYFLEKHGFTIYMVDKKKILYLRNIMNLKARKSRSEDAHILAAAPWHDPKYAEYVSDKRSPLSNIERERKIVIKNITAIKNYIDSDLTVIFPEFAELYDIDSATGMAILYEYTTPDNIVKADKENISKLIKMASKGHYKTEDIRELIKAAKNSIGTPDEEDSYRFKIRMNVNRLKNELDELKNIDNEIIKRKNNHKGIGKLNNTKN